MFPLPRRSDPQGLEAIETTLDAICRTPTKHRAELRLEVKLPVLSRVFYESKCADPNKALTTLHLACRNLKLSEDPYVLSLLKDNTEKGRNKLKKVRLNEKTWCRTQMKSFLATATRIFQELGSWAANYYISQG